MHLVCFIIRIYHDARSPERQIMMNWYIFMRLGIVTNTPPTVAMSVLPYVRTYIRGSQ